MKDFLLGSVTAFSVVVTAVVVFPLVPLWTLSIWVTHDDSDLIDSAADAFEAYLKIIHIE